MYSFPDKNQPYINVIRLEYLILPLDLEFVICNCKGICDDDYVILDLKGILHRVFNPLKA